MKSFEVLFLTLSLPVPPNDGGRLRSYHFLKHIASHSKVTLATFSDKSEIDNQSEALAELCSDILWLPTPVDKSRSSLDKASDVRRRYPVALKQYRSDTIGSRLASRINSHQFDIVHLDHLYLAQYRSLFTMLPVLINYPDVEAIKQKRIMASRQDKYRPRWLMAWLELLRWRRYELDSARSCNTVVVASEIDADYFRNRIADVPIVVVPNGIDTEIFSPIDQPVDNANLVFVGNMSYMPNIDAVLWFYEDMMPGLLEKRPEIHLTVVGRDPPEAIRSLGELDSITVTASVNDVRPYYHNAALSIVPLRAGSGTRLKILEAMALGVPVVSTSVGSEGLQLINGKDIVVSDEAENFAFNVLNLLDQPDKRGNIARHARRTVEKYYDWSEIANPLDRAYDKAIEHFVGRTQNLAIVRN